MSNQHEYQKQRDPDEIYVINLDLARVFWMIAIVLVLLTCSFVFGFYLGNITNTTDRENNRLALNQGRQQLATYSHNIEDESSDEKMPAVKNKEQRAKPSVNPDFEPNNQDVDEDEQENTDSPPARAKPRQKPRRKATRNLRINSRDKKLSRKKPYTIQISIHRQKNNALNVYDILVQKRFPVYIFKGKNSRGETLYYIRVGAFSSERQAQEVHQSLHSLDVVKNIKDSFITNR